MSSEAMPLVHPPLQVAIAEPTASRSKPVARFQSPARLVIRISFVCCDEHFSVESLLYHSLLRSVLRSFKLPDHLNALPTFLAELAVAFPIFLAPFAVALLVSFAPTAV